MITSISGGFHRFYKSARKGSEERDKTMECLNGDGSAIYLQQNFGCEIASMSCNKVLMLIKV